MTRRRQGAAIEERNASEPGAEEQRDEGEDREIRAGPIDAKALAGPEQAKRREHDTDREFERVLGNARQRAVHENAAQRHQETSGEGRRAHRQQHAASGAERDDDEHHFEPFQQHRLEACQRGKPIEPPLVPLYLLAQFRLFFGKRRRFVMERNDSGGAQNSLAQPAHAEQQQQNPDGDLQHVERHAIEQRPERDDNQRQRRESRDRAE